MDRLHRLAAILAVGVLIVGIGAHRTRPVEGDEGGDVVERGRLHRTQQRPHRPTVQLEDAEGVTPPEQCVRLGIIEREVFQDDGLSAVGQDVAEAVVQDREVSQTQEVHLQQAETLDRTHVELGDDGAVGVATPDRHVVLQRIAAHDDAGGVHTDLALQALDPSCGLQHLRDVGLGGCQGSQLPRLAIALGARVKAFREVHFPAHDGRRERFGDLVAHGVRIAQHPRRILDRSLRLDRAVRDDLGDLVIAVTLGGVTNHVGATTLVEVHVDVRHGDAVRIEEPLEDQPVHERIELGDPHDPRDHASGGASAARTHPDTGRLGVTHQVGDDEEVGRETHLPG